MAHAFTPTDEINGGFVSFYGLLNSSKATYTQDELTSYLDSIDIPVLTAKYRDALDAPISVEELLKALKPLQSGKTPGPDGIPVEFLYFFRNTPSHIPRDFSKRLGGIMTLFVRAGRPPRVAKRILYLPLPAGGLAMPNFLIYYWEAVLVTVRWWSSQPRQKSSGERLEAAIPGSYAALSNLAFRGLKAPHDLTVPMKTTLRVRKEARAVYRTANPHTPHYGATPRYPI